MINQTSADWEAIVIDDQSSEEEWLMVKSYEGLDARVHVSRREGGVKGPSSCRNLGARLAKGKYFIFLDSDDLLAPDCLSQRTKVMAGNKDLGAGLFLMKESEYEGDKSGKVYNSDIDSSAWMSAFIKNENPWNVTCPVWRKEAFTRMGGFDEDFLFMEDPELHLRSLYGGIRFKTFYDLPADCYYRINHIDETKSDFYYNSILYRIRFYQKLTSGIYSKMFIRSHRDSIKTGINRLVKIFLFSRVNQFPELYEELIVWMRSSGVFSRREILRYRFLIKAGNSENKFFRAMKVRGLCWRML